MSQAEADGFRVPAWHAQHPGHSKQYPLCGTVDVRGRPTHRVAKTLDVTCSKCLKALERSKPANADCSPAAIYGCGGDPLDDDRAAGQQQAG